MKTAYVHIKFISDCQNLYMIPKLKIKTLNTTFIFNFFSIHTPYGSQIDEKMKSSKPVYSPFHSFLGSDAKV